VIVILPHLVLGGILTHIGVGITHCGDGIIVCYGVGVVIHIEYFQDTTYNQIEFNHNSLQDTKGDNPLGQDRVEYQPITFIQLELQVSHELK
jgi:hypothetical protein